MPTLAQLQQESVWRDQFVPSNLFRLVARLENYYQPGVTNIGAYGDYRHLRGYHRSRNWIRGSRYCTSRSYSVTETSGNRSGGNGNWISAIDIVVGQAESTRIWQRVDVAKKRGQVSYVRQNLLERAPWHVHLSLDRGSSDVDHSALFNVITGITTPEGSMARFEVELPVLRQGSEGADVTTAQVLLGARGFAVEADGDFGPDTHAKTVAMQQRFGAEAIDGIWGPETWHIGITGEDKL